MPRLSAALVLLLGGVAGQKEPMDCKGIQVCGVLALESGYGTGSYSHSNPVVHGLWPQVGQYGNSQCIAPRETAPPKELFPCYRQEGQPNMGFQAHEWEDHGLCAGVKDSTDYFTQLCQLAGPPLAIMRGKASLAEMSTALRAAGYEVTHVNNGPAKELQIAACRRESDGKWRLSKMSDFQKNCGTSASQPTPRVQGPTPAPTPEEEEVCIFGRRGPPCFNDADCAQISGCLRCANSGYCSAAGGKASTPGKASAPVVAPTRKAPTSKPPSPLPTFKPIPLLQPTPAPQLNFTQLALHSIPNTCPLKSTCLFVVQFPQPGNSMFTSGGCLFLMDSLQRCLSLDRACTNLDIALRGVRACCQEQIGGSGISDACPRSLGYENALPLPFISAVPSFGSSILANQPLASSTPSFTTTFASILGSAASSPFSG